MQRDPNVAGQCERPPWSPSWTSSPKRRCLGMHDGHCRRRPTVQGNRPNQPNMPSNFIMQGRAPPCSPLEGGRPPRGCTRSDTNAEQSMNWQRGVTRARQNPHASTPAQRRHHPTSLGLFRPSQEWHWLTAARLMAPVSNPKGQRRRWRVPVWRLFHSLKKGESTQNISTNNRRLGGAFSNRHFCNLQPCT